jgi:hypothetical protein
MLTLEAGRWTLIAHLGAWADALSISDGSVVSGYDFTLTIPGPSAAAMLAFGLLAPRRRRR